MENSGHSNQIINKPELRVLGNPEILAQSKSAYFCSDRFRPQAVFASYDWAEKMRAEKRCVISGFQSRIEADVLDILLRGDSPITLVLAKSMYKRISTQYKKAFDNGNMLIVSLCPPGILRPNRDRSYKRNLWILQNADEVVIGSITPGGMLEKAIKQTGITPIYL